MLHGQSSHCLAGSPGGTPSVQRVTMTLDDELLAEIDKYMEARGYQSRSEAFRDLARTGLQAAHGEQTSTSQCVGALVYAYDHETRELPKRLIETHHDHHDLSVATMHIHLDHNTCLEVAILRGATANVRRFADHIIAERGVRHGRLVLVPVEIQSESHAHGEARARPHDHVRVREGGS